MASSSNDPHGSAASLIDAVEIASKPKRQRRLSRQRTDPSVHKIIADNFKDFSSTQTDVLLRGNPPLTLRERVKAAYRRKQDGEARALGHILYTTLRAEYSQVDAVAGRLMVKDSNEPVRAILKDALNALRSQPPGKGLIMAFFSDAQYIN